MNYNKYDEVINGKYTYKTIAKNIIEEVPTLIGWTDEERTHYDILFTYEVDKNGYVQSGIKENDLFISIMRTGAFGFKIDSEKYPEYIAEKLFNGRVDSSVEKLTELINGIIKELKKKEVNNDKVL